MDGVPETDVGHEEHVFSVHLLKGQALSSGVLVAFGQAAFFYMVESVLGPFVDHCQMVHLIFQVSQQPFFVLQFGLQSHMGIEVGEAV